MLFVLGMFEKHSQAVIIARYIMKTKLQYLFASRPRVIGILSAFVLILSVALYSVSMAYTAAPDTQDEEVIKLIADKGKYDTGAETADEDS